MNTKKILSIAFVLAVGLFFVNSFPMAAVGDNPTPTVTTLTPATIVPGSAAQTLTINGSGFMQGSVVNVNGTARTTTYVSPTQVTIPLTAADLANAANLTFTVTNPSPGGGTSGTVTLAVTGTNPTPVIVSISPTSAPAGNGAFTLTVNGSNFNANSQIRFNGIARPTIFVSPTQLTTTIPATDASVTGSYIVDVVNPIPGGGTSGSLVFTISPTGTTPGLPNTGFGPREENALWIALAALGAIAATAAITLVAKKASAK
ncbi:hypothetical protein KW786_01370 [Candidatus Parcubacteria bacterium]|nr:hypothetical protein [Candidatus Parcubacteria bacterium]